MRQKKIKSRIIAGIIALLAILAIIRINIEPSDYQKAIAEKVETAVELYQKAESGNEDGMYSWYTLGMFKSEIVKAREIAESDTAVYEDTREFYKEFKKAISKFKKSSNKDCLSAEAVSEIKKEASYEYETETSEGLKVTFRMNGTKIEKEEPMNLQVEGDSPWDGRIQKLLEDGDCDYQVLSFLQNDEYPVMAEITVDRDADTSDLQIYAYNASDKAFDTLLRGEVNDGRTVFTIQRGGTYVLTDRSFTDESLIRKKGRDSGEVSKDEKKEDPSKSGEISVDDPEPGESQSQSEGSSKESEGTQHKGSTDGENSGTAQANGNSESKGQEQQPAAPSDSTEGNGSSDDDFWSDEDLWNDSEINGDNNGAANSSRVTLEVRCDTIVDTSKLTNQSVAPYVPSDGVIFPKTEVKVTEGESVFEVLRRTMRNAGIQMEFRDDPLYSGAYIEGINHIYEFDGGSGSGWMYKVNGWFPNYGCSNYYVKDGEEIVWCYTCDIGKDVGDQYWDTH